MLGVILSGGQSSRMGSDKGLLDLHGSHWAVAAAKKLSLSCQIPVAISVNKRQQEGYTEASSRHRLIADREEFPVKGPLLGILSAHAANPAEDLFVLACDMPFMDASVLEQLKNYYAANPADACLFTNENAYEPLCAIYSANGLSHILSLAMASQLEKHSMKYVLQKIDCRHIQVAENQKKYFTNINNRSELEGL